MAWLPWPDAEIMACPIPRLLLALDGRVDLYRQQNDPDYAKKKAEEKDLAEQRADPALAAEQFLAFVKRRQSHEARHKPKKNR